MNSRFTFSTTKQRLEKIDSFIDGKRFKDKTDFINNSIDNQIKSLSTKYLFEFIYLIGFPFLVFLVSAGLALFFVSIIFYVVMGFSGLLLVISFFLFYNQYKGGIKHASNHQ